MSSLLSHLAELYADYKNWVNNNPTLTSDYETAAKYISYVLAGKVNKSHIASEFVFFLSNLLVLYNDRIIDNSRQLITKTAGDTIKLWLTVLEYSEVFLELSVQRLWGNKGKWFLVVSVQILKFISRSLLIYKHKESIILTPPIPPLDRRRLNKSDHENYPTLADQVQSQQNAVSFKLQNSGRLIRRVEFSPPIELRSWKPLRQTYDNEQTIEKALVGRQLVAETIYIAKPLAHLLAVGAFGENTWKPWMVALLFDIASLQLYKSCCKEKSDALTTKQQLQINRRNFFIVLYLLRSPFYEKYTKERIDSFLLSLSKNIPFMNLICGPLMQYLTHCQTKYFYYWST